MIGLIICTVGLIWCIAETIRIEHRYRECTCGWISKDANGNCNGCGVRR